LEMSLVTNIVFSFSIGEHSREIDGEYYYFLMDDINKWLSERNYGKFGVDADKISGGTKCLETPLFVAAFNYFDIEDFLEFLSSLQWKEPENVQVFVKGQEENIFTLFRIRGVQ